MKQLPPEYGAVFLVRTDPERARAVAQVSAEGDMRVVLTKEDACAAALYAAVLRYLQQVGNEPGHSRILVADAAQSLSLAPDTGHLS